MNFTLDMSQVIRRRETMKLAVAIYARVSTEEQAQHGYSLADQRDKCIDKAETEDIVEFIDDGYSGEFIERPALQRMLEGVRNKRFAKVICYDPDRLARKLSVQLLITDDIDRYAELVFVNHDYQRTPEGMLFYHMRGAFAEYEKQKINERMTNGRRKKARQGKVVMNYQMYGYDYDKNASQYIVKESEAAIVRFIFSSFTEQGLGINGIARRLNDMGIPTKRGAVQWHKETVRQMLKQHAYAGTFYQNRYNTEGMLGNKFRQCDEKIPVRMRDEAEWIAVPCPAIIKQNQFDHAQRLLEQARRRYANTMGKNKYLLSGLLRCGECGNTMTGRKSRNWGKEVFQYTDVKTLEGVKSRGCRLTVSRDDVELYVWNNLAGWIGSFQGDGVSAPDTGPSTIYEKTELQIVQRQLADIKKERKHQIDLYSKASELGIAEEVEAKLTELKDSEQRLLVHQLEIERTTATEMDNKQREQNWQAVIDWLSPRDVDSLSFEEKQRVIRMLVREIHVYKSHDVEIHLF